MSGCARVLALGRHYWDDGADIGGQVFRPHPSAASGTEVSNRMALTASTSAELFSTGISRSRGSSDVLKIRGFNPTGKYMCLGVITWDIPAVAVTRKLIQGSVISVPSSQFNLQHVRNGMGEIADAGEVPRASWQEGAFHLQK